MRATGFPGLALLRCGSPAWLAVPSQAALPTAFGNARSSSISSHVQFHSVAACWAAAESSMYQSSRSRCTATDHFSWGSQRISGLSVAKQKLQILSLADYDILFVSPREGWGSLGAHYVTLCYNIFCYIILYSTILYYTILYYTILYYTILYYTILYYTMLCYAMLCYAMLCYAMLCYAMLYYSRLYDITLYLACRLRLPRSRMGKLRERGGARP